MAMTVYVFDRDKNVRKVLAQDQVTALVHDENNHSLHAEIESAAQIKCGEHVGFRCIDGNFRLFTVESAAHDDRANVTDVTATDAIVTELKEIIAEENQQLDVDLHTAIAELLPIEGNEQAFVTKDGQKLFTKSGELLIVKIKGSAAQNARSTGTGWTIRGRQPDRVEKSRAYYASAWEMLQTFTTLYEWRILCYYEFADGRISARVIETMPDEPTFRGRIISSGEDATNVRIAYAGKPITRLYALGPAQGSEDVQTNLTMADAEWSIDAGDPADKPKGQAWVEDVEAVAKYGLHTDKVMINGAKDAKDLLEKGWQELQRLKEPKVSVDSLVADVEMLPGHSHRMIRLGDLVAVRLKNGSSVAARIISVKRDYIHPLLTKIAAGDKKAALSSQVSALITDAVHTFERLTVYKNRFREDEALIQLNAEFIQANAKNIELNAEEIRVNAAELYALNAKVVEVDAEIVNINAELTYVEGLIAKSITTETLAAEIAALESLHVGGNVDVPGHVSCDTLWVNGTLDVEGEMWANDIVASSISCTGLSINEDKLSKTSLTVVTGIDVVTNLEGRITAVQPVTTKIDYYT